MGEITSSRSRPVTPPTPNEALERAGLCEGQVIAGKYLVERVVGLGGMGVVATANHLALGRRVALKLVPSPARDDISVARLRREARALAAIRSEHVARVMDVDVLPNGVPFIVMELLEGEDLGVVVRERGRLPVREAAEHVIAACEVLAEAHALGIVHRDLKPANLFLARRADGSTMLKVLDFGISKVPHGSPSEAQLTAASAILGTPHYMSPEQIRRPAAVDARADVWSLGVILHELLTGQRPFDHRDQRALLHRISTEAPRALRDLLAEAPAELEAVVTDCLQKAPERRPESAGELARRLAPFAGPEASAIVARIARLLAPPRETPPAPFAKVEAAAGGTLPDTEPEIEREDPPEDTPEDPLIGTEIGDRLLLSRRIGEGAMGVVYEAQQRPNGRRVAVKLIRPDAAADPDARARLIREARATATLTSEHVVRLLEAGEGDESSRPYIVMEMLTGRDLARVIRGLGALTPGVVVRLFAQACEGLAEAHAHSLVHRDVKPSNLFLHETPEGRIVLKVCDFGVVRSTEVIDPHPNGGTRTGLVLGSPAYMSPEQARNPHDVGAPSDVFSLCISMYEALSGKNPWAHCSQPTEFIVALWTEEVTPLREIAPGVAADLAAIVHRGLAREPAERWADAAALGEALRRLAGGETTVTLNMVAAAAPELDLCGRDSVRALAPVAAPPAPIQARARLRWAMAAVALIAAVAALVGWRRAEPPAQVAIGPRAPATSAPEPSPPPTSPTASAYAPVAAPSAAPTAAAATAQPVVKPRGAPAPAARPKASAAPEGPRVELQRTF